jgi:serine/threonine protein kinase
VIECPACSNLAPDNALTCPSCNEPLDGAATKPLPSQFTPAKSDEKPKATLPQDSISGGRFAFGEILASRYRIIDMLGRGGMGEVYRAEDLTLKQIVALKFLPETLLEDEASLECFLQEVRIARQIAHPNVCRVYDIGEADRRHFLSMEFIKGEELASVLKRFGRLPANKATEIARQICAGLAAAHKQGVIHRDLKPANIMIDSEGNARITDFGLAAIAEQLQADVQHISGTPAYMSPEQLERRELTTKSDIYSLGLVLYELFTGKRAFEAPSIDDLVRLRKSDSTPVTPTILVKNLDPLIEQTILGCLQRDPDRRPASALQVAAALPGGDPLAAALAMGETPSPEVVAAAATEGTLTPRIALICLLTSFILAAVALLLAERVNLNSLVRLERSSEALRERGAAILRNLGYLQSPADTADGWMQSDFLTYIENNDSSSNRWEQLRSGQPAGMFFWYRESPRYLVPSRRFNTTVRANDPEMQVSGMTRLVLDPEGRLFYFDAVPPQLDESKLANAQADWTKLFTEAGLNIADFRSADSKWVPDSAYDLRAAWQGTYPARPDIPIRIEAAAFHGLPVYFEIIQPWTRPLRMEESSVRLADKIWMTLTMFFVLGVLIVGGFLAWRNMKLGRGDRRGAFRLAVVVVAGVTFNWVLTASHAPIPEEFLLFGVKAMHAALLAGLLWLFYMSLEPLVRRWWPHRIISWNRLLAGNWRDPLVGRDVLLGCVVGLIFPIVFFSSSIAASSMGAPPHRPALSNPRMLLGIRAAIGDFVYDNFIFNTLFFGFGFLFMFIIFYIVLRREWLATAVFGILLTFLFAFSIGNNAADLVASTFFSGAMVIVLLRIGFLAFITVSVINDLFFAFPLTTDLSVWYSDVVLLAIAMFTALVIYGFYTSLGGQKLFKSELMSEGS